MKLVRPKLRLRVRVRDRNFVSSTVTLDDRSADETSISRVHWPWNEGDERFSR